MSFSPEQNSAPLSGYDRCIEFISEFAQAYGRPLHYDDHTGRLRPLPLPLQSVDAYQRIAKVDVQDMSYIEHAEPIVYDVTLFTESGIARTGLIAQLHQELDSLQKTVIYGFTVDKTVNRSVSGREGSYSEEITPDEINFLADQLASLSTL